MVFKRLGNEELETTTTINPDEVATPEEIIESNIDSSEITEEINDLQATFQDINTATELQEELENKVISVEMLKPEEYNLYVANDLHANYTKACKLMGMEPKHISNESMDNAINLSTEGIKEVIANIIETIKQIIGKVINKIRQLWIKIQVMLVNDVKKANALVADYKLSMVNIDLKELTDYVNLAEHKEYVMKLSEKIYSKVEGIYYLASSSNQDFIKILSYYNANMSSFSGMNWLYTTDVKIPGFSVKNNPKHIKRISPEYKELPLKDVILTSIKKNRVYKLAVYGDPTNLELVYTNNLVADASSTSGKEKTDIMFDYDPKVGKVLAELVSNQKKIAEKMYEQMTKEIKTLEAFIKNPPEIAEVKDGEISSTKFKIAKNASVILPRVYMDAISNAIYLNKVVLYVFNLIVEDVKKISTEIKH